MQRSVVRQLQETLFVTVEDKPCSFINVTHAYSSCIIFTSIVDVTSKRASRMEAKATQKPSVDDIWKQLNAKNPRQSGKNFDKLWHGFSSDVGTKAAPSGRDAGYNPLTGLLKAKPAAGDAGGAAKQAVSDVSASATAPMTMERSVQALQATEASLRKAALLNIQAAAKDAGHVYRSEFEDLADSQIGKALLRRFDDPSEVCRELAVATMRCVFSFSSFVGLHCISSTERPFALNRAVNYWLRNAGTKNTLITTAFVLALQ